MTTEVDVIDEDVVVVVETDTFTATPVAAEVTVVSAGFQGPTGRAGLSWQGEWTPLISYSYRDVVYYNGSAWMATDTSTLGVSPPYNHYDAPVAPWELLVAGASTRIFVSDTEPSSPVLNDVWIVVPS